MGSSGMKKRRKGGNRRHLDKVGSSHDYAVAEQQRERAAVLDVMGLGGARGAGRALVWIVFGVVAVVAIIGLLALTVLF